MAVGLRERLLRLAELEFRSAARKLRGGAESLFSPGQRKAEPDWSKVPYEPPPPKPPRREPREPPEIRRYYANLELPVGSTADQVKAAYRQLMRRYHPDRHANNPERARVANQVAQQLRTAYEGLLVYLAENKSHR